MYSLAKSWGPYAWYTFHTISFSYDKKLENKYRYFFELIKTLIPCHICQRHYISYVSRKGQKINENCINMEKISRWLVNMHNNVNKLNRKRIYKYNDAKNFYYIKNKLHVNNKLVIKFLNEFMKSNFNTRRHKKTSMINLFKTIAYIYPDIEKRKKLTAFVNKFQPKKKEFYSWYSAFVLIIFSKNKI